MTRLPHAQLHLPVLSPDEALVFVNILDRLIAAIWRAHGPAMAARLDEIHDDRVARSPSPSAAPHSDDIPF
jgi:hypothetical protein